MARKIVLAAPKSGAAIEFLAFQQVRRYQPEALTAPQAFDVERFFENELERLTGVKPDYQDLPYPVHGYTDSDQMICVVASSLADDPSKYNFFRATVAHEIGHALQHVPEFRRLKQELKCEDTGLRMFRADQVPAYRNPEWQAWRFAKALLMPEKTLRMALKEGLNRYQIAQAFSVSEPFVRSRLKDLRLGNEPPQ